jgi:hypothetical protein
MRRTLLPLALTAALAVTGVAAAAAKKLPACASFTDAKSDAGYVAGTGEATADITKVVYSASATEFVVRISVASLADNFTQAPGDRFQATFKAGSKTVDVYYKRSRTRDAEANVFYQQGLRVDGTFITDAVTAKHDLKANTVSLIVKTGVLRNAVGKASLDEGLSELTARAMGSFVATNQTVDTATAPDSMGFKVAPCVG